LMLFRYLFGHNKELP